MRRIIDNSLRPETKLLHIGNGNHLCMAKLEGCCSGFCITIMNSVNDCSAYVYDFALAVILDSEYNLTWFVGGIT